MKVGDLVRFTKSGKIVIYLGKDGDCYQFWHHDWERVYLAIDTFPPDKREVINASR